MREAVIVSTARTPIGKAYRGAFNDTQAQTLGGHAIAEALKRARIEGAEVDDVVIGAAMQQGSTGYNIGRQAALRAGLPTSVAGMSVDRQCASGLMAISIAAKEIIQDGMSVTVGGGLEFDLARPERQGQQLPQPATRGSSRIATTSTCRCSRPPRSSPSATRFRARRRTPIALQSQQRTAAGSGRRAVRGGDRAAANRDESRRQGDRRRLRQGGDAEAGRGPARRHDARRPCRR